MSSVTYRNDDGIATIRTRASTIEVAVLPTADLILGGEISASAADIMALAAGYRAVLIEAAELRAELAAARAGQVGVEHATAMQGARSVVAGLRQAGEEFMAIYDTGEAPDSTAEMQLRAALGTAEAWLIRDNPAASARAKVLKGGAQ